MSEDDLTNFQAILSGDPKTGLAFIIDDLTKRLLRQGVKPHSLQGIRVALHIAYRLGERSGLLTVHKITEERIEELETICGELYQVIGNLAGYAKCFDHTEVTRAMNNASKAKLVHKDLLPWPKTPLWKEE
jgi:hypothetical protein